MKKRKINKWCNTNPLIDRYIRFSSYSSCRMSFISFEESLFNSCGYLIEATDRDVRVYTWRHAFFRCCCCYFFLKCHYYTAYFLSLILVAFINQHMFALRNITRTFSFLENNIPKQHLFVRRSFFYLLFFFKYLIDFRLFQSQKWRQHCIIIKH